MDVDWLKDAPWWHEALGVTLLGWSLAWIWGTALSLRPFRDRAPLLVHSFFVGWFLSEAPIQHLLFKWLVEGTLLGLGAYNSGFGLSGALLSLWPTSVLVFHALQARRVPELASAALREALGEDYLARLPEGFDLHPGFPPLRLWFCLTFPDRRVRRVRHIPYVEGGGRRQQLDVFLPPGDVRKAPVVLHIHGGGWVIGDKSQQGLPMLYMFARQGFVCVSITYRLSPRARWPDHIVDAKRALVWTKRHIARYGGDPDRILVTGCSAGGHLTALLALTPNQPELQPGFEHEDTEVQAAAPFYGVYDFTDREGLKPYKGFVPFISRVVMQRRFETDPFAFDAASPVTHVREDAPPMFVVHGALDSLVPVEEARLFVKRLRAVTRAPVVYLELPYTQHGFEVFYSLRGLYVMRAMYIFAQLELVVTSEVEAVRQQDEPHRTLEPA